MRRTHVSIVLLALMLIAANGWAQGFGVYEQSACALGRGGATVAAPCNDGSSIFFNPAGIGMASGPLVSVGASIINPIGSFTNDNGNVGNLVTHYFPVPNAYVVAPVGKAAFGVGLFAPYGLTTDWPVSFEGRFLGYKTSVKGIYIQPTVAYKVNDNFAIGGGVDITYASVELNQRIDLSTQNLAPGVTFARIGVPAGTDFANVKLTGNKWHAGVNLGVQGKVAPTVSVGARYLSRQRIDITNGTFESTQIATNLKVPPGVTGIPAGTPIDALLLSQFQGSGALATQGATTSIVFPDQFVAGLAVKVAPKTTVLADYIFTHWALFDQLAITRQNVPTPSVTFENFKNTSGLRVGVEHEVNPNAIVRAGFVAHQAAEPDETVTPLLPEGPRWEISGGFGFRIAKMLHADAYYMYLHQSDRRGRTIGPPPGVQPTTALNNGMYAFKSNLFGITLTIGL